MENETKRGRERYFEWDKVRGEASKEKGGKRMKKQRVT